MQPLLVLSLRLDKRVSEARQQRYQLRITDVATLPTDEYYPPFMIYSAATSVQVIKWPAPTVSVSRVAP